MATWLCDPTTEELVYKDNRPIAIDGIDQVTQDIRKNLKFFLGEWFLDSNKGTPWKQLILVKNPVAADASLKAVIVGTNGVLQLLAFTFSFNSRTGEVKVNFNVQSKHGPIISTVTFTPGG
jgi:hypothetical protein